MRVTNTMVSRQLIQDVNTSSYNVNKVQAQISSGKRILSLADDATGVARALSFKSDKSSFVQYQENISAASAWLTTTSEHLESLEDLLLEVMDVGSEGMSDLMDDESKKSLGQQVNQYLLELIDISNAQTGSSYIFGGTQTLKQPFTGADTNSDGYIDEVTANADGVDGVIRRMVGINQTMEVNSKGTTVFQPDGTGGNGDMFDALVQLRDLLNSGAASTDIETQINRLEDIYARVVKENSIVGAKLNRLDLATTRMEAEVYNYTEKVSDIEDLDLTEATIRLSTEQSMLSAALQMGSKIIQLSLIDYL